MAKENVTYPLNLPLRAALEAAGVFTPRAKLIAKPVESADGPTPQSWVTHRDDSPEHPAGTHQWLKSCSLQHRRPWPTLRMGTLGAHHAARAARQVEAQRYS